MLSSLIVIITEKLNVLPKDIPSMLNIPQLTTLQFSVLFGMGFIFFSVGLFCLLSPLYTKLVSKNKTIAEVVDIVKIEHTSDRHVGRVSIAYYPVFRYRANGRNYNPTLYRKRAWEPLQ